MNWSEPGDLRTKTGVLQSPFAVPSAHFYAYLYRLRLIQRWVLMRSAVPENVAEHSFQVALLTHALCTIGRPIFLVSHFFLHHIFARPTKNGAFSPRDYIFFVFYIIKDYLL